MSKSLMQYCAEHGEFQARPIIAIDGLPPVLSGCPDCQARAEELDQRQKARAAQAMRSRKLRKLREIRERSGIPPRFAAADIAGYRTTAPGQRIAASVCQNFANSWPEQHDKGGSLVLTGLPGTGKTHLAAAIANQVMAEHQCSVLFSTATELLREVQSMYRSDSRKSAKQAIADLIAPDLLVMDEIGVQRGTERELGLLFEIINKRYEHLRPMILISNLNTDDLLKYLGRCAMDRFAECGTVLAFDWPSYRHAAGQQSQGQRRRGAANG